ncbi:hypothetical protein V6615_02650 [Oscillospiraceae bacterium PP1C4]
MLRKLLKYEIKATGRQFLPLYGALLLFSIINKIFFTVDLSAAGFELPIAIGIFIYGAIAVAIFVLTFIVMIQRFYKNLLSDEGYLMFTLPVKTWELIVSKLITAILWMVASLAVTAITLLIMAINTEMITAIPELFSELHAFLLQYFGISEYVLVFELILVLFATIVSSILLIYVSIAIGHLSSKHRFLASFGAFIGLNVVEQMIYSFIEWILGTAGYDVFEILNNLIVNNPAMLHLIAIPALIITLATAIAYFFITSWILSRKLNLE